MSKNHLSIKLNLTKLTHAIMPSKKNPDEKIIMIPVKANGLYEGKEGNIYLDLIAFAIADEKQKDGQTHLVKKSLPKEATEDEKKNSPIIGSIKNLGGAKEEAAPVVVEQEDDLPF